MLLDQAQAAANPDGLLADIQAAASHHMYGKEPIDDMTIVIVRFGPHVPAAAPAVPAN